MQKLRASARRHAASGDALLAYVLEDIASEGIDLDRCTPYETLQERYGLGDQDAAGQHSPGAA